MTAIAEPTVLSPANSPARRFPMEYTRNIGIAAHIDAGKTTTTERVLFYAGVIHKMGDVHDGNTVTDWMEQERERGITITAAAISAGWTTKEGKWANIPHTINIIDTPGHVDFTAEVERSLRVLDGAIAVFCAVAGVQPQSETVWRQMNKYKVCRIAYVNKMDRTGANFFKALDDIRNKLKGNAHPLFIPYGAADTFFGVIDLVKMVLCEYDPTDASGVRFHEKPIPESHIAEAKEWREKLIEALADFDDTIAEKFLEGKDISIDELRAVIRKATLTQDFVGVIPGSALKNKGVQMVLDGVVNYLPNPLESRPMTAHKDDETTTEVFADDKSKPIGLVFKLWTDQFVGRLVFFRLYAGTLKKGDSLYNPRTRRTERISRLLFLKADERVDVDAIYSGEICAVVGAKDVITGDTLCSEDLDLRLEPPTFPEPVISMSIEPKTKADQEKLSIGLQRLASEDPTFKLTSNPETGQTIIAGMGELHLEIIRDRLFREFKVEADAGRPQIAYRETITMPSEGVGKFIRQSGGKGQYGHVEIKLAPNVKGKGVEIINDIVGGVIPKEFIKPSIEGIEEAAKNGTIAGYPVIDFIATIVFGSFHEVDSNEMAFKMAGIFAFKDAMQQAKPILLEPIMKVEVVTPSEYQGDVVGDLNRRRGQIQGMETKTGLVYINANVPLETMFGYSTDVRSLSKGRASYSMEPSHFEQVPQSSLVKIVDSSTRKVARTI
ncbi:MAG TPA: elongation factor G [Opitutales bacterium]|jgi:elongation factor G|nr:elongation factor G [Opitutales bacterium]